MTETDTTIPSPAPPPVAPKATLAHRGRRLLRHGLVFFTFVIVVDAIAGEKGLLALLQADLREQARRLREDPAAIEDQARRQLGLIKPGEMVFFIKDVDKKP